MINIGIVGSRTYTNKDKIVKILDQCIKKYGANKLCVVSGAARGADTLGRVIALQKGLNYIEFNPAHEQWNKYSGKPKEWYNKPYHVGNYFERNTFIAENSHILFAFIPKGHISNGTQDTVNKMKKLNKPYYIID